MPFIIFLTRPLGTPNDLLEWELQEETEHLKANV